MIYSYIIHTNTNTHTHTQHLHTEHAHIFVLTLYGCASSNRQETKNPILLPAKKVKNLAQQKLLDGSEMRRGMGTGAAGYGKEKALTPISSATRGVPTHMLCSYSCLNWPLADSNGFWVRATSVIPFSISVVIFKKHTIFLAFSVTWLAKAPLLKISLHRAAVKPIKSFISSPMQTNPSMVVAASISQQVVNKLVFLL